MENGLKGNENWFELARGSSYWGFELSGVDCRAGLFNSTWGERQSTILAISESSNNLLSKAIVNALKDAAVIWFHDVSSLRVH